MTQTVTTLALKTRTHSGTGGAKAARRAGMVPGVLYGHNALPLPIAIDAKELAELLHAGGRTHLLSISIDGSATDTALVKELQRHPITRAVIHADLQRVSATEEVPATLAVHTVGIADGVKNQGGVLDIVLHTLDVRGPANDLPDHIEIDVSALRVHDHVTAGQIKLPSGITLATPPETIVISVEGSKTASILEEADTAAAAAAPEVPTVADTDAASAS